MATVIPIKPFDRAATDRRVRHPLHSLRGYIRTYVLLEGAFVALIYLAAWFWIGLALDWGPFRLFAFDWVQELNGVLDSGTAGVVRGILLCLLVGGLLTVVGFKIVRRLLTEFSDASLALVLERRFPRELGDRLITAVELADPKLSQRYGFSQGMIDHTIRDAADRVERVPVRQVFNWARLSLQGLIAGLCTLGVYLLVFAGYAIYATASSASVGGFFWRFNDVAGIWTERNVLLMNTYWPRNAYLELLRFQDTPEHPGEMRVARDEARPELIVRAAEWVVADRKSEGGWRPLRWADLKSFMDEKLLQVPLPESWGGWVLDLDDLDPAIAAGPAYPLWQGKRSGDIRKALENPDTQKRLPANVRLAVAGLLDWHTWTVDRIEQQVHRPEKTDVREPMRRENPQAVKGFDDVFARLNELAEDPSMSRRLRKLVVPEQVFFTYRGNDTKGEEPHDRQEGNKYTISLADLKESVRFTIRGEDYYTPSRSIELKAPPSLTSLTKDTEAPAYIYYRLQGSQLPLKGRRQQLRNVPVSITGEVSPIPLPLGSSVELHGRADRALQLSVSVAEPAVRKVAGSTLPSVPMSGPEDEGVKPAAGRAENVWEGTVRLDADGQTFHTGFKNVTRPIEFEFQFYDRDGIKGRRHVVIEPIDDRGPQEVVPVELLVDLLTPKGQTASSQQGQPGRSEGLLVTPDAILPLKGTFQDDYGLADVSWLYKWEEAEFELASALPTKKTGKEKPGELILGGNPKVRRARVIVAGLQGLPLGAGEGLLTSLHWAWIDRLLANDLLRESTRVTERSDTMERFRIKLEAQERDAINLTQLDEKLQEPAPRPSQLRMHDVKDEDGFDFRRHLRELKSADPTQEAQLHYRVQLYVAATDNNIETGPTRVLSKVPITLLVVSENELLARIFLDEDQLRQRLDKAVEKLDLAKRIMDEQVSKLQSPLPQPHLIGLVGLRAEEVKSKGIQDAASGTREVSADYNRLLRVMQVNRVTQSRVDKVDNDICRPLEEMLDPRIGNFAVTEAAVTKLLEGIEADMAQLKALKEAGSEPDAKLLAELDVKRVGHLRQAEETREQLARLLERMKAVLNAIGGELVERELIAILVRIERELRIEVGRIRAERDRIEWDLLNPGKKDKLN
jgi:hypothetical protein